MAHRHAVAVGERRGLSLAVRQLEQDTRLAILSHNCEFHNHMRLCATEDRRRAELRASSDRWMAQTLSEQEGGARERIVSHDETYARDRLAMYHTALRFKHEAARRAAVEALGPALEWEELLWRGFLRAREEGAARALLGRDLAHEQRGAVEDEEARARRDDVMGEQTAWRGRIAAAAEVRVRHVWAMVLQRHWRGAHGRGYLRGIAEREGAGRAAIEAERIDSFPKVNIRGVAAAGCIQRAYRGHASRGAAGTRRACRAAALEGTRSGEMVGAATRITALLRGKRARREGARRAEALHGYLEDLVARATDDAPVA